MRPIIRQFRCRRAIVPVAVILFLFTIYVLLSTFLSNDQPQTDSDGSHKRMVNKQDLSSLHQSNRDEVPQIQAPKAHPGYEKIEPDVVQLEKPDTGKSNRIIVLPQSSASPVTLDEVQGGHPTDPNVAEMRNVVRQMTKEAWDAYVEYAWTANELRPLSKTGHQPEVLGKIPMGATIVDGMDTLYIMGLKKEFQKARDFVAQQLDFDKPSVVSVFEYTIRFLGGLLSSYSFTLDEVFLTKAIQLADRLLPAFNSTTGIPFSLINLHDGYTKQFSWSISRCSILSEMGTMHMEFTFLSELTGDMKYAKAVYTIREILSKLPRSNGLFYNYVNPRTAQWCGQHAGLSGLADSFYEYLLKEWIRTDRADIQARRLYDEGVEALFKNGLFKESAANNLYVGAYHHGSVSSVMDHLACFAGGMLALGSSGLTDSWFDRGVRLTNTCRLSYENTATHLGPESFEFGQNIEAVPIKKTHKSHLLRPETVESYFYMWRYTKNPIYRDWAWDVVLALKQHANTSTGYSGLINVNSLEKNWDDVQQSYFLAETLKYLYLIFSEDTLLPLDRWVFNSEAHPLPVHNKVTLGNTSWPKLYTPPRDLSRTPISD